MNSILNPKTATQIESSIPSTFGMPIGMSACGHVSTGVIAGPDAVRAKGDVSLDWAAVRTYQGTNAWSPPKS